MAQPADPMNQVVYEYLDHYFTHFSTNFEAARAAFDEEAIHQFRVAIKRIRSVYRAVNNIYPGHPLPVEYLELLRDMFKAGGTVRDDQVQVQLLSRLELSFGTPFPLIRDQYQRRIQAGREVFLTRSKSFDRSILDDFSRGVADSLAELDGTDMQTRFYGWMDHAMEKLRHRRHKATDPYRLHRFRTRFKELFYIVEMIYASPLQPNLDKKTIQKLKNTGQTLGDWHDHYQLWARAGDLFVSTNDTRLMEEAFHLKKLLTPLHNDLFNAMQDNLRQEGLFTLNIL